jgi:hypothetical protein
MTSIVAVLAFLVTLTHGGASCADEILRGNVIKVESRGVVVPIYAVWKEGAVATVVLYSGGGGGYGKIGDDG